jgi:hypothetical protein
VTFLNFSLQFRKHNTYKVAAENALTQLFFYLQNNSVICRVGLTDSWVEAFR